MSTNRNFSLWTLLAASTLALVGLATLPAWAEESAVPPFASRNVGEGLSGNPMTDEMLGKVLEDMGYDVRRTERKNLPTIYKLPFRSGNVSGTISVEISTSGNYVWLSADFADWNDHKPTGAELLRVLDKNRELPLSFFRTCIYTDGKHGLELASYVPNCISRSHLRKRIDLLIQDVMDSSEVWSLQSPVEAISHK